MLCLRGVNFSSTWPLIKKPCQMALSSTAMKRYSKYDTLTVSQVSDFVFKVSLDRPKKLNAMNSKMWREIGACFAQIGNDADCRSVVLCGNGKHFCSGLDIFDFKQVFDDIFEENDVSRRAFKMKNLITSYQANLSAIEKCRKPVIAAVHGYCIGGAISMVSAADIRFCTSDTNFSIKEIDLGIAADVGAIQRLSKAVGNISLLRELVYSGTMFDSSVAAKMGMVSHVYPDQSAMQKAAEALAVTIAEKSPVTVQTVKESLNYSRDHSVAEGLKHIANLNSVMLQSEDLLKSLFALMQKKKADFDKL